MSPYYQCGSTTTVLLQKHSIIYQKFPLAFSFSDSLISLVKVAFLLHCLLRFVDCFLLGVRLSMAIQYWPRNTEMLHSIVYRPKEMQRCCIPLFTDSWDAEMLHSIVYRPRRIQRCCIPFFTGQRRC